MEALFQSSPLFIFFFAIIAIFIYTDFSVEQRLCVIYISVYALIATGIIGLKWAFGFLFLTMFCFLEIFVKDFMKLKLLTNPFYKLVDCMYLSFSQYYLAYILLAVSCYYYRFEEWIGTYAVLLKFASIIPLCMGIIKTLRQKYVVYTFQKMYHVFAEFPINRVGFNEKLDMACSILVSIEDSAYFTRKAYSIASPKYLYSVAKRVLKNCRFTEKCRKGTAFIGNILTFQRGYSTLPMQLIRTLGIQYGYNCKIRRKLYEILYSRMFFDGAVIGGRACCPKRTF